MAVFSFPFHVIKRQTSRLYPSGTMLAPFIPVVLTHGACRVPVLAIADSGADYTIMSADLTALLGVDLRAGERTVFCGTSGRQQDAYIHPIDIEVKDHAASVKYRADVAFANLPSSVAGLLGRVGFFDHFVVTFNHARNLMLLRSI